MRHLLPTVALIGALFLPSAIAQFGVAFAGYAGYNFETSNPMVGLAVDVDNLGQFGAITGGAWVDLETQFEDNATVIQIDVNATPRYDLGDIKVAVGVGFAWERFSQNGSSGSNTGWNLLAGVQLDKGSIDPFVRYRCSFFDGYSQETAFAGVLVTF